MPTLKGSFQAQVDDAKLDEGQC